MRKGIGGRHLQKIILLSEKELERFDLNLGELLDIIEILHTHKENFKSQETTPSASSPNKNPKSQETTPPTCSSNKNHKFQVTTPPTCSSNKNHKFQVTPLSVRSSNENDKSQETPLSARSSNENRKSQETPSAYSSFSFSPKNLNFSLDDEEIDANNNASCSNVNDGGSPMQETTQSARNLSCDSNVLLGSDSDIDTEDEIFNAFATHDQIKSMSNLERKATRAKIINYNSLKQLGIPAQKPYLHLPEDEFQDKRRKPTKTSETTNNHELRKKTINSNSSVESDSDEEKRHRRKRNSKSNDDCEEYERKRKRHKRKKRNGERDSRKEKQKKKEKGTKEGFKMTIPEDLQAFLESDCLDNSQKDLIRKYLENPLNRRFHVREILLGTTWESDDDSDTQTNPSVQILFKTGVVFDEDLRRVVGLLLKHLYQQVSDPSLITVELRESLAVSFVATFPQMAQEAVRPNDLPWTWLFDRQNNSGKLAHHHATKQKQKGAVRLRGGGTKKKTGENRRASEPPIPQYLVMDDVPRSKDAKHLALLSPDDNERHNIEKLMNTTYEERRELINNPRCPTGLLLLAFPHIKSFQGRMIDYEFDKLYGPEKGHNLLRNFQDLVPKLLVVAKTDPKKFPPEECLQFGDSVLNSIVILSKFLPRPRRVYAWEENMPTVSKLEDFVDIAPEGYSTLHERMNQKRACSDGAVQPYILATGTAKKIDSLSVALGDSHVIRLPNNCSPVRAVDILLKSLFVLGSHFPLGWKNVYRFLCSHVYKIPPENPRLSNFTAEYKKLMAVKID